MWGVNVVVLVDKETTTRTTTTTVHGKHPIMTMETISFHEATILMADPTTNPQDKASRITEMPILNIPLKTTTTTATTSTTTIITNTAIRG
jgi:hypothetical protein